MANIGAKILSEAGKLSDSERPGWLNLDKQLEAAEQKPWIRRQEATAKKDDLKSRVLPSAPSLDEGLAR